MIEQLIDTQSDTNVINEFLSLWNKLPKEIRDKYYYKIVMSDKNVKFIIYEFNNDVREITVSVEYYFNNKTFCDIVKYDNTPTAIVFIIKRLISNTVAINKVYRDLEQAIMQDMRSLRGDI